MKLFTYGTLKKDKHNHYLMERASFLGNYHVAKGYTLRVLNNGLPILLHDGVGPGCYGELYEVDDQLLRMLDKFEGHPHMYERTILPVYGVDDGDYVDGVQAYLFPYHVKLEKFPAKGTF